MPDPATASSEAVSSPREEGRALVIIPTYNEIENIQTVLEMVMAQPGRLDVLYDGMVEPVTGLILLDSALVRQWDVWRNAAAHLVLPG